MSRPSGWTSAWHCPFAGHLTRPPWRAREWERTPPMSRSRGVTTERPPPRHPGVGRAQAGDGVAAASVVSWGPDGEGNRLTLNRRWQRERGASGRWKRSAPGLCSAQVLARPRPRSPLISRTAGRPQRMSRWAWYSTSGAIVSPRAFALFTLNEQTRTPNAGAHLLPKAGARHERML